MVQLARQIRGFKFKLKLLETKKPGVRYSKTGIISHIFIAGKDLKVLSFTYAKFISILPI